MNHPENPQDIVLVVTKNCKPGKFLAVASYADLTPHRDTLSLDSESARKRFVRSTLNALLPKDATEALRETFGTHLEARLIAYATCPPGDSDTASPLPTEPVEVDVSRIARPELFHTPDVSGLTIAVMTSEAGKLVPRWRTYLRWADG